MPETVPVSSSASAEKAYAAASEAVAPASKAVAAPAVEFPPKAKRAAQAAPAKAPVNEKAVVAKAVTEKAAPAAKSPAAKPHTVSKTNTVKSSPFAKIKDVIMSSKTAEPTAAVKEALADAQAKAKEMFTKSSALLNEAGEFTKGNAEALVASGKILANGLKDITTANVAEGKAAVETLTADVKSLTAVKSPADFVKLQGDIARRNLDQAIALGTKNTEALTKLATEMFAPISGRFKLAVEKVKKAA